ncbi:hypothetical protein NL676_023680 [Syzygium grande]|nr:hypothetical protein NL676_023680 [Syzygium grande]
MVFGSGKIDADDVSMELDYEYVSGAEMASSGAPSPGSSPVELRHCIAELLRFTLQSRVDGTLNLASDLGLSVEFCSALLRDDPPHDHRPSSSPSPSSESCQGVPAYPLYKRLASALEEAISSGVSFLRHESPAWFNQEDDIHDKEVLDQLISCEGAELLNILKSIKFELHVQEPYFTQLRDGLKTIEGRCAHGNYKRYIFSIVSGDLILFNKCLVLEVQDVHWYASFLEMLGAESLSKVLPGVNSVDEGVQVYRKFYAEEKEKSNGVLAIGVSRSVDQPYISLARIISGLTSKGVQKLLAALQSKYSCKNNLAKDVIGRLVATCQWQNLHAVPPHGVVFEIRDVSGYGARWSEDGAKFIGFLEPYVKDGHMKGWKH